MKTPKGLQGKRNVLLHQVTTYELYITNMQKLYITCNCTVTTQTADAQNVNKFVPRFVLSPHKSAFENFESRIFDLVYDDDMF